MHEKKEYTGGDSKPHTLHAALSALISVDWARFQSLYTLSLLKHETVFSMGAEARELTQLTRGSLRRHELKHVVHYAQVNRKNLYFLCSEHA